MQLSQHFSYEELTVSEVGLRKGLVNIPGPTALENLRRLAAFLEEVRTAIGRPILINSAFRSRAVNEAVGGKPSSQHLLGCAADFHVAGLTPMRVVRTLRARELPYDQLICEFATWTHISIPVLGRTPRGQVLWIDKNGAQPFDAVA